MKLRIRAGVLVCLALAAAGMGMRAFRNLKPDQSGRIPGEVYARYSMQKNSAEYYLRPCNGFVAVFRKAKDKSPVSVTAIELGELRTADRAMVEKGIPVADRLELLSLLEDLGS